MTCAGWVTPHPPVAKPTAVIEPPLSKAERQDIFDTVWQTVNDGYFDPTSGGKDWQAVGKRYRQRLETVQDDRAFWLDVFNPMVFELGVSHIGALPPEFASQSQ